MASSEGVPPHISGDAEDGYQLLLPDIYNPVIDVDRDSFQPASGIGVILEEGKDPRTKRSMAVTAKMLVDFEEGEAYFTSGSSGELREIKEYLTEVSEGWGFETPDFYVETSLHDLDSPVTRDEDWYELVDEAWTSLHGGEVPRASVEQYGVPEPEPEPDRRGGSSDFDMTSYFAATAPIGTTRFRDDLQ